MYVKSYNILCANPIILHHIWCFYRALSIIIELSRNSEKALEIWGAFPLFDDMVLNLPRLLILAKEQDNYA